MQLLQTSIDVVAHPYGTDGTTSLEQQVGEHAGATTVGDIVAVIEAEGLQPTEGLHIGVGTPTPIEVSNVTTCCWPAG